MILLTTSSKIIIQNYQLTWFTIFQILHHIKKIMPLITGYNNISTQNHVFFIMSLIILSIGILFLIIGYGIYSPSIKNVSLDNELITIPKIGHIDLIKDSKQIYLQS